MREGWAELSRLPPSVGLLTCSGAQGQLLLPVTDVLLDARWPAPVFVPLLLPITPLDKAEAPTLQHMLHRLLRLQEKDVLAYAQTPAASRSVVRRMFQVGWPSRAVLCGWRYREGQPPALACAKPLHRHNHNSQVMVYVMLIERSCGGPRCGSCRLPATAICRLASPAGAPAGTTRHASQAFHHWAVQLSSAGCHPTGDRPILHVMFEEVAAGLGMVPQLHLLRLAAG